MEKYTNAIFVGEPTGARPNHYGDAARIVLPHSGLTVRASTLWWQDVDPRDTRPWTPPQISAALTSADYRAARDPALRAALTYSETKSLSDSLLDALTNGGAEAALKLHRAYRADPAHEYLSTEGEINTLGYRLLRLKRIEQAIEIFKLNVADYPRSANVYDSLADAYEAAGQKELAIKSSEQVLATLPHDTSDEGRKNGIRAGTLERLCRLKGTKQ
jgi:tetratricopeptide (TPR) repeat protein